LCTGIFLLPEHVVLEYAFDCILCTGIFLLPEDVVLEQPYLSECVVLAYPDWLKCCALEGDCEDSGGHSGGKLRGERGGEIPRAQNGGHHQP
jgi:hypothetical protein